MNNKTANIIDKNCNHFINSCISRRSKTAKIILWARTLCISLYIYLAIGNANPEGIFQTRVYGFDGLQTRVPGFDYVSPAGGR